MTEYHMPELPMSRVAFNALCDMKRKTIMERDRRLQHLAGDASELSNAEILQSMKESGDDQYFGSDLEQHAATGTECRRLNEQKLGAF